MFKRILFFLRFLVLLVKKSKINGSITKSDKGLATPDKGSATPVKGPATPVKGPATPVKGPATPVKGPATPDKGLATPDKGLVTSVKGPTTSISVDMLIFDETELFEKVQKNPENLKLAGNSELAYRVLTVFPKYYKYSGIWRDNDEIIDFILQFEPSQIVFLNSKHPRCHEFWLRALEKNPELAKNLPQDTLLVTKALSQNGLLLEYIPIMYTESVIYLDIAMKSNPEALNVLINRYHPRGKRIDTEVILKILDTYPESILRIKEEDDRILLWTQSILRGYLNVCDYYIPTDNRKIYRSSEKYAIEYLGPLREVVKKYPQAYEQFAFFYEQITGHWGEDFWRKDLYEAICKD